jgi:hypothetical protein
MDLIFWVVQSRCDNEQLEDAKRVKPRPGLSMFVNKDRVSTDQSAAMFLHEREASQHLSFSVSLLT